MKIVHVYEEYVTDSEGAILIIRREPLGYYFLSFFLVTMIVAELSHFVFPFLEDGGFHYLSGMYTAALPLVPAAYGLVVTLREVRRLRREERP